MSIDFDVNQITVIITSIITVISIAAAVVKEFKAKGLSAAIDALNAYLTPGDKTVSHAPDQLTPAAYLMTNETKLAILNAVPPEYHTKIVSEIGSNEESGVVTYVLTAGTKWYKIDYGQISDFGDTTTDHLPHVELFQDDDTGAPKPYQKMSPETKQLILDTVEREHIDDVKRIIAKNEEQQNSEYQINAVEYWFKIVNGEIAKWGKQDCTKYDDVVISAVYIGSSDHLCKGFPEELDIERDSNIFYNVMQTDWVRYFTKWRLNGGDKHSQGCVWITGENPPDTPPESCPYFIPPPDNGWPVGRSEITISLESEKSDIGKLYSSVTVPIVVSE